MGSHTQTYKHRTELLRRSRTRRLRNAMLNPIFSCVVKSLRTSCRRICTRQSYLEWRGGCTSASDKQKGSHQILPAHLGWDTPASLYDLKTQDLLLMQRRHVIGTTALTAVEKVRNVLHAKDRYSLCFVHPIHPDDHQRRTDTGYILRSC